MDEHLKSNRAMWDCHAKAHAGSAFYDVAGFKRGRCSLSPVEREEVGDVAGRRLMHLQCHFGMDTLSWARRGARVTGVDFSSQAIELAGGLAAELGIDAEFICCAVPEATERASGPFDIVFTSQGVLCWLPDLHPWAEAISRLLAPGGVFYVYEFHPMANVFDDEQDEASPPTLRYPYFHSAEPLQLGPYEGSYASAGTGEKHISYEWAHSLSDVVNALLGAGLRLEFLHEFDHCTYRSHPFLTQGADGLWRYAEAPDRLPLMFSIRAIRA